MSEAVRAAPPAIIMVAPNGARLGKADHPQLPISTSEIVVAARECKEAGASALHLHIRDVDGSHCLSSDQYAETLGKLGGELGPAYPVQVTTEAAGLFGPDVQIGLVETLRPSLFSVSIAEIHRGGHLAVARLFAAARSTGLSPQIIVYSTDDIALLVSLIEAGVMSAADARAILLVVGRHNLAGPSKVDDLLEQYEALAALPSLSRSSWMACGFGLTETEILATALRLGGHIRVGFENSVFDASGAVANDNASRVRAAAALCRELGRPIATPAQACEILIRPT
jgi:3-keto-5-aminohexanoate cleavage enzyme